MKKLVLLELNEINFDVVREYCSENKKFVGLNKVLELRNIITSAETQYSLLEPWIQWPSAHTGKRFHEHNIFRLGDIEKSDVKQIFEEVEDMGFSVGALSPMNALNKLRNPAYFMPDPWTRTPTSGSFILRALSASVSQAVNDNASAKLSLKSIFSLLIAFLWYVPLRRYFSFASYALKGIKKRWNRALFLDLFLSEVHLKLFVSKKPNFSILFLNAGAHIQHHYLLSSSHAPPCRGGGVNPDWYVAKGEDPVFDMLQAYDQIVCNHLALGCEVIVATGLTQVPYEKPKYYYRLREHMDFMETIGLHDVEVLPRMTRDFLVRFKSAESAEQAARFLSSFCLNGEVFFGEIDLRGSEIFVTLTYPHEIIEGDVLRGSHIELPVHDLVVFVAIKNGMHCGHGYAFATDQVATNLPSSDSHVAGLYHSVKDYFSLGESAN